jgi:hypothetical protein
MGSLSALYVLLNAAVVKAFAHHFAARGRTVTEGADRTAVRALRRPAQRNWRRRILPVGDFGIRSTNSTSRTFL